MLAGLAVAPSPATAQGPVVLDPGAILALAETPWRDRARFADALDDVLGGIRIDMPPLPERLRQNDPFLWSLTGRFGADLPGIGGSGGIVVCSRYGLDTRARLSEHDLSDPEAFALFGATQAAGDDMAVWPEAGIARLACMITWNDSRRVEMLSEAPARAALAARFAAVFREDQREGGEGRAQPTAYGIDGYRLTGRDGARDTVVHVESARIELRAAHQQIRFRAFLLNGGT